MVYIELIEQVNANQDISATNEQIHDLMVDMVNRMMDEEFKGSTRSVVLYDTFVFGYKHTVNDKTRIRLFVSKGYKSFEYEIP